MISDVRINPPLATYNVQAHLNDLRSINYIYGSNGTGKTTISRVIDQSPGHEHCQLVWQSGTELERLVYNQDFVDKNFNQDGPLQGVFTLGENQVEAEAKIAQLQPIIDQTYDQISRLNIQLDGENDQLGKRKELDDLEPALITKCWGQKDLHDAYFQVAFTDAKVRGDGKRFKEKVLSEANSNTANLLTLEELKEKAQTIFSKNVGPASRLINISTNRLIEIETSELLQKVIVGNQDVDIATLIDSMGNSDWVKQGLKYHQEDTTKCPFCQQPTNEHFADSLSSFFSEAYDSDIQALNDLFESYQRASEQLLSTIKQNIDLNNQFLNIELYNSEAQALAERIKANQTILSNKLAEPSRKLELEPIEPFINRLQGLISEADETTTSHNQTVSNIGAEKNTLIAQVWRYVLSELDNDLREYKQNKSRLTKTIDGMEKSLESKWENIRNLQSQVQTLEKETTSIQPTVTAINELLLKFGFHSFSLGDANEGRHYRIIRANGEDASNSLSEGEKTFVTFLYFYHLIKGAQSPSGITANRVVVFDDPISSLDSDILYIVSSLIKTVMEEVRNQTSQTKQVFILTHNVYFHKEISFNPKRPSGSALNEESFWLVKKLEQGSSVIRCEENPIRSAYELLWEDVKAENTSSVSLQNTLRRILENYFTMWGGMNKDDICALFEGRDKLICQSLFSWVNDGSHSIHDDLYINQGDQTNDAYLRVFQNIFREAGQLGHYQMMTGTVPDNTAEDPREVPQNTLETVG